jgi:hypothetical protein
MFAPGSSFKAIAGSYDTLVLSGLPDLTLHTVAWLRRPRRNRKIAAPVYFLFHFFGRMTTANYLCRHYV